MAERVHIRYERFSGNKKSNFLNFLKKFHSKNKNKISSFFLKKKRTFSSHQQMADCKNARHNRNCVCLKLNKVVGFGKKQKNLRRSC